MQFIYCDPEGCLRYGIHEEAPLYRTYVRFSDRKYLKVLKSIVDCSSHTNHVHDSSHGDCVEMGNGKALNIKRLDAKWDNTSNVCKLSDLYDDDFVQSSYLDTLDICGM